MAQEWQETMPDRGDGNEDASAPGEDDDMEVIYINRDIAARLQGTTE